MVSSNIVAALLFAGSTFWQTAAPAQDNTRAGLDLYHPRPPASGQMSYRYLCQGGTSIGLEVAMDGKGTLQATRLSLGAVDGGVHLETLNSQLAHLLWVHRVRADCTGSGVAVTFLGTYWPTPDDAEGAAVTLMWAGGDAPHVSVEGPTRKLPRPVP